MPDMICAVDFGCVELVAFGECLENSRAEVLGVKVGERALADFADAARGANCVDDICY